MRSEVVGGIECHSGVSPDLGRRALGSKLMSSAFSDPTLLLALVMFSLPGD